MKPPPGAGREDVKEKEKQGREEKSIRERKRK
jgi:hypothetical protein